jgi:hypothetical protein
VIPPYVELLGPPLSEREALIRVANEKLPEVEIEAKVHAARHIALEPIVALGEEKGIDARCTLSRLHQRPEAVIRRRRSCRPMMSPRDEQFQRPRTMREVVAAYGTPRQPLPIFYDRVFAILVDGKPFGDVEFELERDPTVSITLSEDFWVVLGSIYLLDGAGFRNFAIRRRPRSSPPDLELVLGDGREVYFEFTQALAAEKGKITNMREQINEQFRAAMRGDPSLEAALENWYVSITMAKVPRRGGRDAVVAEIVRFVKTVTWSAMPQKSYECFDSAAFPLLAQYGAECYVASGDGSLTVNERGGTLDPYEPYALVAAAVERKSKPGKYNVAPLWLGISTGSHIPMLNEAILDPNRVESFNIEDTPFEKIIVGWALGARTYERATR